MDATRAPRRSLANSRIMPCMPTPFHPVDQRWWFKLGVIALAVATTVWLFHAGGIALYADGVLSARTLLFFFGWFGLERVSTGLIWGVIVYFKPHWSEPE